MVAAYPNGSVYAQKMSAWTRAIHDNFPTAKVALIGERYNDYSNPREDNWNHEVLQNPVSAHADAATLHIYCPLDEQHVSSDPANVAKHLATAFYRVNKNQHTVATQIPTHLRVWVTEMGVYPGGALLWTWLEALFYVLMDVLLPRIRRIDILTPYCLVCGDPTAPSFITDAENAVVPPADAGKVPWSLSLKGHAQSMVFMAARGAEVMTPLQFSGNRPLDPNTPGSETLVGWLFGQNSTDPNPIGTMQANDGTRTDGDSSVIPNITSTTNATAVLINTGAASVDVKFSDFMQCETGYTRLCRCVGSYPKHAHDIVRPGMSVDDLGSMNGDCARDIVTVPAYGIVTVTKL